MLERFFLHFLLNLLKPQEWYALCYVDRDVNAFTFAGNTNRLLPTGGLQKSLTLKFDKEFSSSSERFSLKVRAMHPSLKTYAA